MNTFTKCILVRALTFCLVLHSERCFCQPGTDIQVMHKFAKKFGEHRMEFTLLAGKSRIDVKSGRGDEFDTASSFENIADRLNLHCDFLEDELLILSMLDSESDKCTVREFLQYRIQYLVKLFEITSKEISLNLDTTKQPAVAVQGKKLKDDFKELKEVIQALNDKFKEGSYTTEKSEK